MEMFLSAASPGGVKSEVAVTERLPFAFLSGALPFTRVL